MIVIVVITIFMVAVSCPIRAGCLPFDKISGTGEIADLSETCFCQGLSETNKNASQIIPVIERYAANHIITDTLLFCAYRNKSIRNNASVFAAILQAWKRYNPLAPSYVQAYLQAGELQKVDTLCSILDNDRKIEVNLMLRWVDVKQLLGDVTMVSDLYCRIIDEKPQLCQLVLYKFGNFLKEIPADSVAKLLESFTECSLDRDGQQWDEIFMWTIEQYGEKHLFFHQRGVVSKYTKNNSQKYQLFMIIATNNSEKKFLRHSLDAASSAYAHASDSGQKKESALLLFRLYKQKKQHDSALVWLERAGSTALSENMVAERAEAHLNTGDYKIAADLLHKLPESLMRDTLMIRKFLLSGDADSAFDYAYRDKTPLSGSSRAILWRVRTALFKGSFDTCNKVIQSVHIQPASEDASMLMDYRHWLKRLSNLPEELAVFGKIEYNLYRGDFDTAAWMVCSRGLSPEIRWRLAVRTARWQCSKEPLSKTDLFTALKTLRCAPAATRSEYLYCLGDVLLRCGETEESKKTLEHLVTGFPQDIHTTQARLLLSKINDGRHR